MLYEVKFSSVNVIVTCIKMKELGMHCVYLHCIPHRIVGKVLRSGMTVITFQTIQTLQ